MIAKKELGYNILIESNKKEIDHYYALLKSALKENHYDVDIFPSRLEFRKRIFNDYNPQ